MNFIVGTAGFAREVDWLIHDVYRSGGQDWRPRYFVGESGNPLVHQRINGVEVIDDEALAGLLSKASHPVGFIAVGEPALRRRLRERLSAVRSDIAFPALTHPSVQHDRRDGKITVGEGAIVCAGAILATDIRIGEFAHVNFQCTLGHDARIGAYSTLSPGVRVSGNVQIGEQTFIGSAATIVERVSICPLTTIGPGAVVLRDVTQPGTYFGVPARPVQSRPGDP